MTKPKDFYEYITSYPEETQLLLERVRVTVKKAAPQAEEVISYGMPAFKLNGMLVWFAAHTKHIGFYPGVTGIESFKKELSIYKNADNHPTFGNGKICYIELPSRDINESSFFFEKVFGWKIRTRADGSVAFDDTVNEVSGTWRTDRKPSTGLGLLVHIMVDDIEETIKAVIDNGGKIVQPPGMEAPEITARFSDPTGNILGLFQQ